MRIRASSGLATGSIVFAGQVAPGEMPVQPYVAEQIATVISQLVGNPRDMTELALQQWNEAKAIEESYSGVELLGDFFKRIASPGSVD